VGPSIASGSQTYSGICADLPVRRGREQRDRRGEAVSGRRSPGGADLREDLRVGQRPEGPEDEEHREETPKSPIRFATNAFFPASERSASRTRSRSAGRSRGPPLPPDETSQVVVREHQGEHGEHEEVEVDEVPGEGALVGHVPHGVDVDEEPDAGDDQGPSPRRAVELQPRRHEERPGLDPGEEDLNEGPAVAGREASDRTHRRPRRRRRRPPPGR